MSGLAKAGANRNEAQVLQQMKVPILGGGP